MMCTTKSKVISVFLSICLIASFLPGCSKNNNSEGNSNISATPVEYNAQGNFSTTLTVPGAKFSNDLTATDVTVGYTGVQASLDEIKKLEESGANVNNYEGKTVDATIGSVTRKSNDTIEVTYTDSKVKENAPSNYNITVSESKTGNNKQASASIEVEYPQNTLQPNINYVLSTDKEIRLSLELKEGAYSENVGAEDVTLSGSFENLKIDSISSAGKNLTLQLTGDVTKHESSGVYLDGVVTLNKNAMKEAAVDAKVSIPVQTEQARFVAEKMTADGSKVTVPLTLIGVTDLDSISKDNIKFERDVSVTDVKKDSDTQATLTLDVTGATGTNSAANILDGQTVTVADNYTFTSSFASAKFYPVFDCVEKEDNNLKFTLELYANSGTFADNFNESQISLGEEFSGGRIISLNRISDSTSELIISVPAGNNNAESFEIGGEVTLSAGSMTNAWGEATSEDCKYYRNYTQEEIGRDFSSRDINMLKNVVGGFGNTTFGTITSLASGAYTGYQITKTILELSGIIKSDNEKLMDEMEKISGQLTEVQNTLNQHTRKLNDIESFQYMESLREFNTKLNELQTYCNRVNAYYEYAASDEFQDTLSLKKPATGDENVQDGAYYEYSRGLIAAMLEADKNKDGRFFGFEENLKNLDAKFVEVTSYLNNTQNNPIYIFDKSCTYIYNFDTSAYQLRESFRLNLESTLSRAVSYITLYYSPVNPTSTDAMDLYVNSYDQLQKRPLTKRTDGKALLYVKGATVYVAENPEITEYYKAACKRNTGKDVGEITDFTVPKNGELLENKYSFNNNIIGTIYYATDGKVYIYDTSNCMTTGAMLKVSELDSGSRAENFTSIEYTMFCERLNKRDVTLQQDLESAGINVPKGTEGMAVDVSIQDYLTINAKYIKWGEKNIASENLDLGKLSPAKYNEVTKKVKILACE